MKATEMQEVLRGAVEDPEEDEEEEEYELPRGITEADKRKIRRLHNNLGHPNQQSFLRALRIARARPEVIQFVKDKVQVRRL